LLPDKTATFEDQGMKGEKKTKTKKKENTAELNAETHTQKENSFLCEKASRRDLRAW
jgi:hypothetical protein